MSAIEIRPARPTDLAPAMAILAAWNMAPRPASGDCPDPERSGLDLERTFVAVDGGRIVGVASWLIVDAETAETASLAVDRACRGSGVGYRLQAARLAAMKAQGFRRVRTETDRPETIRWYERHFGYRRVGTNRKKHAFSLPDVDHWTVLELDLDAWQPSGEA